MTIKEVINKFQEAAQSISTMNFRCCFLYELTQNETYPLTVLIPPRGAVEDWKQDQDTYEIELWVMNQLLQSSTDHTEDTWKTLQNWGFDIVQYLDDNGNFGTGEDYWLKRPVRIEFEPVNAGGNDMAPAVVFKFKLEVKHCKT